MPEQVGFRQLQLRPERFSEVRDIEALSTRQLQDSVARLVVDRIHLLEELVNRIRLESARSGLRATPGRLASRPRCGPLGRPIRRSIPSPRRVGSGSHDGVRLLANGFRTDVVAHSDIGRMPQLAVRGPLRKLHFDDELRFHPVR